MSCRTWSWLALASALICAAAMSRLTAAEAGEITDSCERCHGDPRFLVENKKLYDYFQNWRDSIHGQAGVSCVDCHGGDPKAADKEAAHAGRPLSESGIDSPTHFRNIPQTCAQCHSEVYEGYRQSKHFQKLQAAAAGQAPAGPNCVTCHGSVNVSVLRLGTMNQVCRQCHNSTTGLASEVPDKAAALLDQLYTCQVYYRTIVSRDDPTRLPEFVKQTDPLRQQLAVTWHSFALDQITQQTRALLDALRAEMKHARRYQLEKRKRQPSASPAQTR